MVPEMFARRTRLNALLDRAVSRPVTLVSAGPGYGKTLTLADWAQRTIHRVGWLSIQQSDDQLPGFWSALSASLRACGSAEPGSVLAELAPAASFGVEDAERVIDALAELPTPLVIVLDDVQHLRDRDVLRSIELLLDRLTPTLRIVVSARYDPALRLRRLAISDRLTEIRADHLAFNNAEAAQLLAAGGLGWSIAPGAGPRGCVSRCPSWTVTRRRRRWRDCGAAIGRLPTI